MRTEALSEILEGFVSVVCNPNDYPFIGYRVDWWQTRLSCDTPRHGYILCQLYQSHL